jgi:hypothetical protein
MIRRPVYHPAAVRRLVDSMRADLHAQHLKHLCELADLRAELDAVRGQFEALRNAVLERTKAEAEVELLKRDRERCTRIADGERYWLH